MPDVGVLNLQIHDNSIQAEQGLQKLADALFRVKRAVNAGLQLDGVATQIKRIAKVVDENISGSTITKLADFGNSLARLRGLGDVHINIRTTNVDSTLESVRTSRREIEQISEAVQRTSNSIGEGMAEVSPRIGEITRSIGEVNNTTDELQETCDKLDFSAFDPAKLPIGSLGKTMEEASREANKMEEMTRDSFDTLRDSGMLDSVNAVKDSLSGVKEETTAIILYNKDMANTYEKMAKAEHEEAENIERIIAENKERIELAERIRAEQEARFQPKESTKKYSLEETNKMADNLTELDLLKAKLRDAENEYNRLMNKLGADDTKTIKAGLAVSNLRDKIWAYMDALRAANAESNPTNMDNLTEAATKSSRALEVLKNVAEKVKSAFSGFKDGVKSMFPHLSRLAKQFVSIARRMAIRAVIKQFTGGLREGLENVYYYSKAVGTNFAPAMDSAASSLLQMKNSIGAALAPAIQALIPVLQTVVNWFINLINYVNQFFALLNGQQTWTRALPATTTAFNKQEKAAKKAGAAVKDLLADWDELNIIQSNTSGAGSGAGTSSAEDYLKMFEEVSTFDNKIKDIVGFIKDNFDTIAKTALTIGASILAWKISSAFGQDLSTLNKLAFAAGTIMIGIGFTLISDGAYSIGNDGVNATNILETAGGVLATTLGGSWIGAAAAKALGYSAASGALVGAVVGLVAGLIFATYEIHLGIIDSAYGTLSEDVDTIRKNVEENYLKIGANASIEVINARIADEQAAEKKVGSAVASLNNTYPIAVKVGTKEALASLLESVDSVVSATNSLIEIRKKNIKIPIVASGQFEKPEDLIKFTDDEWTRAEEYVKRLGTELGEMISEGIKDGVKYDEIQQKLLEVAEAITYGQKSGEFAGNVALAGSKTRENLRNGRFDKETVENYYSEYQKLKNQKLAEAEAAALQEKAEAGSLLRTLEVMYKHGEATIEEVEKAKEIYENFDVAMRAEQLYNEWIGEGEKIFIEDFMGALQMAMQKNAGYHGRRGMIETQIGAFTRTGTLKSIGDDMVDQMVDQIQTQMIMAIKEETGMDESFIRNLIAENNLNPMDFFDADYINKIKDQLISALDSSVLTEDQKKRVMAAFGFEYSGIADEVKEQIDKVMEETKANGNNVTTIPVEAEIVDIVDEETKHSITIDRTSSQNADIPENVAAYYAERAASESIDYDPTSVVDTKYGRRRHVKVVGTGGDVEGSKFTEDDIVIAKESNQLLRQLYEAAIPVLNNIAKNTGDTSANTAQTPNVNVILNPTSSWGRFTEKSTNNYAKIKGYP